MTIFALLIFAITLIYFFLSEYVTKYIWLLFVQGFLLFIIGLINLSEINLLNLILILSETLIVKSLIIPYFLNKLQRTNNLKRLEESQIPVLYSIIIITFILIISFITGNLIQNNMIDLKFFTISLSGILSGIYLVIINKNIFHHIVGLLIIENGAFLLSLAVGNEFPYIVSMAVLIDVLIATLIIGLFLNKISDKFGNISTSTLNELKD